ncbi:MAG: hypothetical protein VX257_06675, partial [Planctomycetota bacterium]|nr:hypothetical protein [Planctomycetota bacterium]
MKRWVNPVANSLSAQTNYETCRNWSAVTKCGERLRWQATLELITLKATGQERTIQQICPRG